MNKLSQKLFLLMFKIVAMFVSAGIPVGLFTISCLKTELKLPIIDVSIALSGALS